MKKFAFFILILVVTLGLGTIFLYTDFFLLKEIDIESGWIPKEEILQLSSLEVGQNLFYLNQIDLVKKILLNTEKRSTSFFIFGGKPALNFSAFLI